MSLEAQQRPTCFINNLPEEVLERIFELAVEYPEHWDGRSTSTARRLTLVCKAWLRPARRILYSYVSLRYTGQAMLVFSILKEGDLGLAPLVRRLNAHDLFQEGPTMGFSRLVELLPNLEVLSIYARQWRGLRHHPMWSQLRSLQMRGFARDDGIEFESGSTIGEADSDADEGVPQEEVAQSKRLHMTSEDFPAQLEKLAFKGSLDFSSENQRWLGVVLPGVKTFVLDRSDLMFTTIPMSPEVRVLPAMPALTSFEAFNCVRDDISEVRLIKLIRENKDTLENLRLFHHGSGKSLLSPVLMRELKHLHTLDFRGTVPDSNSIDLRVCLPSSLRRLKLHFEGSFEFGMNLLELLSKTRPFFLPNLEEIPSLAYSPSGLSGANEVTSNEFEPRVKALVRLSASTHTRLLARGNISTPELRLPLHYGPSTIICLPYPADYLSALQSLQRDIMTEFAEELLAV